MHHRSIFFSLVYCFFFFLHLGGKLLNLTCFWKIEMCFALWVYYSCLTSEPLLRMVSVQGWLVWRPSVFSGSTAQKILLRGRFFSWLLSVISLGILKAGDASFNANTTDSQKNARFQLETLKWISNLQAIQLKSACYQTVEFKFFQTANSCVWMYSS